MNVGGAHTLLKRSGDVFEPVALTLGSRLSEQCVGLSTILTAETVCGAVHIQILRCVGSFSPF